MEKYHNYSLEDFLADATFRKWVKTQTVESNQFWEDVQIQFPNMKETIAQARLLVLSYNIEEKELSEETISQAWYGMKRKQLAVYTQKNYLQQNLIIRNKLYRIAATLTFLTLASIAIWYNYFRFEPMIYETKYGQVQTIALPDGSKVILNANSRLEINLAWSDEGSREVNLKGEAFFEVEKKPTNKQKFIVHTADLDVVVLGTRFNVNNRQVKTSIVLTEGSVKLAIRDSKAQANDLMMQVGDLVEFSKADKSFTKQRVNTEKFSSWKDNKLIFENTQIADIASLIKETYGLDVLFEDEKMGRRKISGTIPSENLEILLTSLETIFNVKIVRKQQQLIFEK